MDYVRIFDTTLRDGEQSPGASMSSAEKIHVARALARLGVDVIEAGFPAASPDDFNAVRTVAELIGTRAVDGRPQKDPPIICGLARANAGDIDRAWEAIQGAARPRIHTFLATSDLHLQHKLRMSRDEALAKVEKMVAYARSRCGDVEFSPEDAGRSDPEFLYKVLAAAIAAGATTLNIPDTVGYTTPDEYGALIAGIRERVPGARDVILSVHCHDDLGLAVANTLAGLHAGARQAEVTMNGIGERAGNAALEEVVMALDTRRDRFQLATGVDPSQLCVMSKMVSTATGFVVPPNKAIVGQNAFAHESGIHQDGMLKHSGAYEIMRPERVGAMQTWLVLGKHSGRHAFAARLRQLGHALEGDELERAFAAFKALADKKQQVNDADLLALATSERQAPAQAYTLEGLQVTCGTMGLPTATVKLRAPDGKVYVRATVGTGPVDAAYKAVDSIVSADVKLTEFMVQAVTQGIDALGEVSVRIAQGDATAHGYGADSDIVVASVRAYLAAVNLALEHTANSDAQGRQTA